MLWRLPRIRSGLLRLLPVAAIVALLVWSVSFSHSTSPSQSPAVSSPKPSQVILVAEPKPEPKPPLTSSAKWCIHVEGFSTCRYFQKAAKMAQSLALSNPELYKVSVKGVPVGEWDERKLRLQKELPGAKDHTTSPFVWLGCPGAAIEFVGGADMLQDRVESGRLQ
ncbi:uncharacterized protein BJ171DRAFT_601105 [Polychytrium aggregatum]|uniref:uncharacterized protein n=1 Tax=Polychytrium aggregatum TaxID=110093 RepID=UPI0022FF1619|nr:uncharacterized protein BJ171DRAFT_601105 [Polychytrium aggregatum]KAI9202177.1 hypothetical protein BJ171DRAFT_601105 [Polychytrium aggregatum]